MKRSASRNGKAKAALAGSDLSDAELDRLAAPFDREFVPTKPLTAAMKAQERRARRKRGRPVVGDGATKVLISVERSLLRRADDYAKRHKKNRSQVIAECLQAMLVPQPKRRAS